jgi:hypothetical protein
MSKRPTTRGKRVARKPVARLRSAKSRAAKPHTRLIKKVVRRNPQKLAIKRKIRQKRPIHKRVLLHPVTVLIVLCIAVFVATWTYRSLAASFDVTASVAAAPLTQGAVITSPSDGQTVSSSAMTVSGSCPDDSYVTITDNSLFMGSSVCVNNIFQVATSLYVGTNSLTAQDYNADNDAGPSSPSVSVTYTVPPPAPAPSNNSSSDTSSQSPAAPAAAATAATAPPLLLTTPVEYNTFSTQASFSWQVDLQGGVPPYVVTVNWGDGTTTTYTFDTDPVFTVTHTYATAGYYPIQIATRDAVGTKRTLQVATIIHRPGQTAAEALSEFSVSASTTGSPKTPSAKSPTVASSVTNFMQSSKDWLFLVWPSLLIVIMMIISFWLGERQELRIIFTLKRRRPPRRVHY